MNKMAIQASRPVNVFGSLWMFLEEWHTFQIKVLSIGIFVHSTISSLNHMIHHNKELFGSCKWLCESFRIRQLSSGIGGANASAQWFHNHERPVYGTRSSFRR